MPVLLVFMLDVRVRRKKTPETTEPKQDVDEKTILRDAVAILTDALNNRVSREPEPVI
jgi:hypothetical protein